MKRIISAMLAILIVFSLLLVRGTYSAQIIPLLTQPIHNINTGLNYTTIQAAIDAPETLDGHTLRCDAGNYTENVQVHKSLNIIGAGPTLTSAWPVPGETDTGNNIFYITANSVTIQGFTIQSVSGSSAISLDNADNCSITNNVFKGGGSGILLGSSNDNTISCNEVDSLPGNGIELTNSSQGNEIVSNNLNGNHYGIILLNASNYNEIANNFVNATTWDGIRLNWLESNFAPVEFNTIANNIVSHGNDGIFLDYPSSNNFVSSNFASNNTNGIHLRQASNSTITHNTLTSNTYGIYAETSTSNCIYDNFLNNNNAWDNGADNWNTTRICLINYPNVIGGMYTGGSYWSNNPNPIDANHDGFGDIPYNVPGGTNKDYLPLVNETQNIVKIANPQRNTWYQITRPIYANGTIGPVDPLIIDLDAIGISPGGSYNWTVAVADTCFDEPSLVSVTWLSPDKISLTWNPPTNTSSIDWSHWPFPTPLPSCMPPWPPLPWPFPLFFSWSALNISCKYAPLTGPPVTDSFNVVVEYGLASEPSIETLQYGQSVVGIGQSIDIALPWGKLGNDANTCALLAVVVIIIIIIIIILVTPTSLDSPPPQINPYIDINQSATYAKPWNIINRSAADILASPQTDLEKAEYSATQKMIDVCDILEGLRVTYYRKLWAEKVVDEEAILLQEQMFRKFFVEYISRQQELQTVLDTLADEVKATGDIIMTPQNISDSQAELWTKGFTPTQMKAFQLFDISPSVIGEEKEMLCMYNPEKLSGNVSSCLTDFTEEIGETNQKLTSIVFEQDNAIMDVAPFRTTVEQGFPLNTNTNVTIYCGVPVEPMNITLYANQTIIGSLTNVTFACGNCTIMTIPCNTTGLAYGNYAVSAYATPVPGETDTSDNNFTMYAVTITIPGDINGDFKVDLKDLVTLANAYGSAPGSTNWNPNADMAAPWNVISLSDLVVLALHYGQHYP